MQKIYKYSDKDINDVKLRLKTKFNIEDLSLLDKALLEASNKGVPIKDVISKIENTNITDIRQLSSDTFANLLIKEAFDWKQHHNIPLNWNQIINDLLADKEALKIKLLISQFGLYNFTYNEFEGDYLLKGKLDFEVLKKLVNDKKLLLSDLQLNLYDKNDILVKHLLLNEVNNNLVLQSNYGYNFVNKDAIMDYIYSFKLPQALLTHAFCNQPDDIKGITLINNKANKTFDIYDYSFKELANKFGSLDYLLSDTFKKQINDFYQDYLKFLKDKFNYKITKSATEKQDINTRLFSAIDLKDIAIKTDISEHKDFKYYKSEVLLPEENKFKFIQYQNPTASQLNNAYYLLKSAKFPKQGSSKYYLEIAKAMASKYNLEFSPEQLQILQDIFDGKEVDGNLLYSLHVREKEFDADALTRMNFGNQCEEVILNHLLTTHNDLNIKQDKRTLFSKTLNSPFDIDGYIGRDLNHIDKVVEIKNSANKLYFDNPDKLLDAYKMQLCYYYKALNPKNGLMLVGALTSGSQSKLVTRQYIPSQEDLKEFDILWHDYKKISDFLLDNNLFNIKAKIITLLKETKDLKKNVNNKI